MTHEESYRQLHTRFVNRVERFVKRYDLAPSRFGREATNDPTLVFRLRDGHVLRPESMDRVERFMADYKSRASSEAQVQAAE